MNAAIGTDMVLGEFLSQSASLVAICSLRMVAVAILFPPISDALSQRALRSSIVIIFSIYVAYGQSHSFVNSLHGVELINIILRELIIGLMFGFCASTVFWVVAGAGVYIDNFAGFNNVQLTNPMRQDQSTPTSVLLTQIAIVAFWSLGGMMSLLSALYQSYNWWPLASPRPVARNVIELFILRESDSLMKSTSKLMLPVVFVLVLIEFGVGFVGKAAPKLDLSVLGQPIKGAVTLLMLGLLVGLFVDQMRDQLTLRDFGVEIQRLFNDVIPVSCESGCAANMRR